MSSEHDSPSTRVEGGNVGEQRPGGETGNPLKGRPLDFLPVNFSISTADRLKGYAGAPAHARRARRLEDLTEAFWTRVEDQWNRLRSEVPDEAQRRRRWQVAVAGFDYQTLARHADEYNRYYPIEANLPMDPVSGGYLLRGDPFRPAVPPDPEEVLRRFPAT